MDDRRLARLEHDNFVTALDSLAGQVDGSVRRRADGVVAVLTGNPLRLFNQILIEDDDAAESSIGGQVASAIALARERGDPFMVSLRSGTDGRFVQLMSELGLVPISDGPFMPGMAMHPIEEPSPERRSGSAEHLIRVVDDEAGIEDHVRTVAAGFEMAEAIAREVVTPRLLGMSGIRVYVGYVDGRPVTTGLGFRTDGAIGVYNIATVPTHRRRGYGEAMTRRIVEDGVVDGCTIAILQASDMGRPVYERMGFRTVVEYLGFVDPPGEDAPGAT